MQVLLLCSGGREHCWREDRGFAAGDEILVCAGNAGIAREAECVASTSRPCRGISSADATRSIGGGRSEVAHSGRDRRRSDGRRLQGVWPTRLAAQLEGSKGLHQRRPRIRYSDRCLRRFTDAADALATCARRARRSWSRPMGWPPARASSSPVRCRGGGRLAMMFGADRRRRRRSRARGIYVRLRISFFALCDGETASPWPPRRITSGCSIAMRVKHRRHGGLFADAVRATEIRDGSCRGSFCATLAGMKNAARHSTASSCRRDGDGSTAQTGRIQCPLRRSQMPGADAADDVGYRAGVIGVSMDN